MVVCQRAVTEFLGAENVTPAEIHRRLQAVYGENTVNRTTVKTLVVLEGVIPLETFPLVEWH